VGKRTGDEPGVPGVEFDSLRAGVVEGDAGDALVLAVNAQQPQSHVEERTVGGQLEAPRVLVLAELLQVDLAAEELELSEVHHDQRPPLLPKHPFQLFGCQVWELFIDVAAYPAVDFGRGERTAVEHPVALPDAAEQRQGGCGAVQLKLASRHVQELDARE
jgi:hypothetical protein